MATAPVNTDAIAERTGRSWPRWVELLDLAGCREQPHAGIARQAQQAMPDEVANQGWWAQSVALGYEQHHGMRAPGQSCDGDFQLSISRTVAGDRDSALETWTGLVEGVTELDGVPAEREPTTSRTEKWRYWRVPLADGSRVSVTIGDKAPGKATVGLLHSRLADAAAIERWRAFWKPLLAQL